MKTRRGIDIAAGVLNIIGGVLCAPVTLFLSFAFTGMMSGRYAADPRTVPFEGGFMAILMIAINIDFFVAGICAFKHKGKKPAVVGGILCLVTIIGLAALVSWEIGILYMVGFALFALIAAVQWNPLENQE